MGMQITFPPLLGYPEPVGFEFDLTFDLWNIIQVDNTSSIDEICACSITVFSFPTLIDKYPVNRCMCQFLGEVF